MCGFLAGLGRPCFRSAFPTWLPQLQGLSLRHWLRKSALAACLAGMVPSLRLCSVGIVPFPAPPSRHSTIRALPSDFRRFWSFLMKQLCRISSSLGYVSSSYQPPVRADCTRDRRPERAGGGMCIFTKPIISPPVFAVGLSDCSCCQAILLIGRGKRS